MSGTGRQLLPKEEIRRLNSRVLELLSLFLNLEPDAITEEMMRTLMEETGLPEERCYAEYLAALCGLDAGGKDKGFFRNYFLPMVRGLDAAEFRNDPYLRNIRFPSVRRGAWEWKTLSLAPYEAFVAGDLEAAPDGRLLPRIGFFREPFFYPAVLEDGREWMTLLPNEIITARGAVDASEGDVLTYGLGLGYYTYHVSLRPNVTSVTVVERDPAVISLFRSVLLPQFPAAGKIRLLESDALTFAADGDECGRFDTIYADIWHDAGDGAELYRRLKKLEDRSPRAKHLYWLEDTIRCYGNRDLFP